MMRTTLGTASHNRIKKYTHDSAIIHKIDLIENCEKISNQRLTKYAR